MKITNWILGAAVIAIAALSGCTKKEQPIADIIVSVDPTTLSLDQAAQEKEISLTATRAWKAEITYSGDSKEWVSLSSSTGPASTDKQKITVTVKPNTSRERIAKIKFSIGLDDATLTVTQAGPGGSSDPIYFNNFDKAAAVKEGNYFPYAKDTDCWRNEKGTGIAGIEYVLEGNNATIRSNMLSTGSGVNNWFFGKSSLFCVKNIALPSGQTNYVISFYGIRNVYGATSGDGKSIFNHDDFKLYVSSDASKWVKVDYVFEGGDPDNAWAKANAVITVPAGTTALCIGIPCPSESSVYRLDDVMLDVSETAGTAVDFTKGIAIPEFAGGGEDPVISGTPEGDGSKDKPFNATAAILKAQEVGQTASTDFYYIKGVVSSVASVDTGQHGNANFYITDTKEANTGEFYCFQVMYIGGAKFTSSNQINKGDEVVVYAQVVNYKGNIPETNGKGTGKIISINGVTDAGKMLGVSATSISAKHTDTNSTFKVTGNVAWTASCDNADFTLSATSGTGETDVTVNYSPNSAYTARTAKITVSTTETVAVKSFEITLTQAGAPDPSAKFVELTNAEIVQSLTALGSTSTTYTEVTYTSACGTWTGNTSPSKSNKWVQIRDTKGSYLKSPEFASDIEKIEISTDANKGGAIRTFYAVPSTNVVPYSTDSYTAEGNKSVLEGAYGKATTVGVSPAGTAGEVGETVTISVTGATKSFMIITTPEGSSNQTGAAYINSIKVYLKK